MLGPRATVTEKDELHKKEKAPNNDNDGIIESNILDDNTVTTTVIPVNDGETTEANENMTTSDAEDSETREDPEPATVVNENDDTNEKINDKTR